MHTNTKARRNLLRWTVAGPFVVLLAVIIWAWPFMAITQPSGSKVLVVEGWMDPGALEEAARLVLDSGYTQVYTTGTVRAFAYYLEPQEGISLAFHDPVQGRITVSASGTGHAGFYLIAGNDTLLSQAVQGLPSTYSASLHGSTDHLRIVAWPLPLPPGTPAIYVGAMEADGMNVNMLQRRSWIMRPGEASEPAWPTYAQSSRAALIRMGVPASIITAVPAYGMPRSRTWGNAHAFGAQARQDGITAFDVATVGVHARRSRNLFQAACGPQVKVGVVALADPYCTRANWWRSYRGWYTMMKEVVGAPELKAVKMKQANS
ncbi:MAG: hypothetical protein JST45_07640 [Bacteroidetes bacterium]|nr:hypothetical protein [Bacteroidota bacterium]